MHISLDSEQYIHVSSKNYEVSNYIANYFVLQEVAFKEKNTHLNVPQPWTLPTSKTMLIVGLDLELILNVGNCDL